MLPEPFTSGVVVNREATRVIVSQNGEFSVRWIWYEMCFCVFS